MVLLYMSVLVAITLICLLCPDLDGLVLNDVRSVAGIATRPLMILKSNVNLFSWSTRGFHPSSFIIDTARLIIFLNKSCSSTLNISDSV